MPIGPARTPSAPVSRQPHRVNRWRSSPRTASWANSRRMRAGLSHAARYLDASLALATACAAPFDRALTLVALAEVAAATGQRDAALPLLDEVRGIATPLHALPLLARADALALHLDAAKAFPPTYPAGLSAREVAVLRLLAAGRTNRDIAAALFVSANTVRTHVTHILEKTQTDNRAAAAAFAERHGLA